MGCSTMHHKFDWASSCHVLSWNRLEASASSSPHDSSDFFLALQPKICDDPWHGSSQMRFLAAIVDVGRQVVSLLFTV